MTFHRKASYLTACLTKKPVLRIAVGLVLQTTKKPDCRMNPQSGLIVSISLPRLRNAAELS